MGCCGRKAAEEDAVELQDMKHFKKHQKGGINVKRKCRDLLFACLFIAFWAGMLIIAAFAISKGSPERLTYGEDSDGNVCGQNNVAQGVVPASLARDLRGKPYLYFPLSPPSYISVNLSGIKRLCVDKCPSTTSLAVADMICDYDATPTIGNAYVSCWPPYASTAILHLCVPTQIVNETTAVFDRLNSRDFVAKVVDDIKNSWKVVVVACVAALLVGLLWLVLMRFFAGVAIWFSIWSVVFLMIGITAMFWLEGTNRKAVYESTPPAMRLDNDAILWKAFLYTAYVLCGISAIVLLVVLFSCSRIHLAAMICEEASKAFGAMFFQLILWPLVPFVMLVILGIYFVAVALYAITILKPDYNSLVQFTGYSQDYIFKGLLLYHLFGTLWTFNWIIGISEVTVCGAVADWYWSFEGKEQKPFAVLRSFGRTLRYHLGSVAFGALLLGIIQFIRIIMLYIQSQFKGKENRFTRIVMAAVNCILACFERFIRFLTKNAYVMIAVYGYSFCNAARRAFKIMANNPIRVAALNCVNVFNMFLGKLFITLVTTIGAFVYLKNYTNLNFFFFPLGFIAVWSFVVACVVMSIYDMAVHTILYCFVEDEARNDGSADKPYHMSSDLQAFLDTHGGTDCCCC